MDKSLIESALKKVKDNSAKRNFKQSLDLIMNFKGLDLKKPEHQVNLFVTLPYGTGKKISVCALVDSDLAQKAGEACDETILLDEFEKFRGKAAAKRLADRHDFFVAQASIMPKVATVFGRYFGPRGKMPNPKIGSVITPASNVRQLCDNLKKTVLLVTKNEPTVKCRVGNEDTKDEEAIDNITAIYNNVAQKLPGDKDSIKSVMLKLTMGPSFAIGLEEAQKAKSSEKSRASASGAKAGAGRKTPAEEKAAAARESEVQKPEAKEDAASKAKKLKPKARKESK